MFRTTSNRMMGPKSAWIVTTAMAGALLAGCTTSAAPRADLSANRAQVALANGKHRQAIAHAEAAVLAEPHNASYRAVLGSAYLEAGRFASARTSFDDAMKLGDTGPRTVLSLALSLIGEGQPDQATALLTRFEDTIAPADLGLALALGGQPDRGVQVMSQAIRSGDNDAKIRQNLAYAYALAGRWREARLMAAQDVPADQVGERMEQWAMLSQPDAWQHRVATLLEVPVAVPDEGQPIHLALGNSPSLEQLAAEATAVAPAELASGELSALAAVSEPAAAPVAPPAATLALQPYATPESTPVNAFASAFAPPVPAEADVRVAQAPVVQSAPTARSATAPARSVRAAASESTHLVQLGSFGSEQGARRAWNIYVGKYPELAGHEMVISEAVVRGKRYWRVAAAGFGRSSASSMCGEVRASGAGCLAYAEGRPLPGAVDRGVRLARR